MNLKELEKLIKIFEKSDINQLKVEEDGIKIEIQKSADQQVVTTTVQSPQAVQVAPAAVPPPQAATSNHVVDETIAEDEKVITSPMVGTFYAASSPENPPFVKVGDKIRVGDPVCIIEAMKLFNEIESEVEGTVVKILVNNEDTVEFGQALIVVK